MHDSPVLKYLLITHVSSSYKSENKSSNQLELSVFFTLTEIIVWGCRLSPHSQRLYLSYDFFFAQSVPVVYSINYNAVNKNK